MIISYSLEINDSREKLWNTLKSFDGVERYFQIVSKSKVEGIGQGAKRTCDVNMGSQTFQIQETLEELDDTNHSITVFLDNGPIQMKGMRFTFVVRDMGNGRSEITISTNVENPEAAGMAKCIFAMMCQGLKNFHEL